MQDENTGGRPRVRLDDLDLKPLREVKARAAADMRDCRAASVSKIATDRYVKWRSCDCSFGVMARMAEREGVSRQAIQESIQGARDKINEVLWEAEERKKRATTSRPAKKG